MSPEEGTSFPNITVGVFFLGHLVGDELEVVVRVDIVLLSLERLEVEA